MADAGNGQMLHEGPGVDTRWVLAGLALLLALIVLALVLVAVLYRFSGQLQSRPSHLPQEVSRVAPRLQVNPLADLAVMERRQERLLHQDAAMSIEDAMRAVAARPDPYAPLGAAERPAVK